MKLLCMAGLPGAGKSALATELGQRLAAPVLDKDRMRLELFGAEGVDYSREQDDSACRAIHEAVRTMAGLALPPAVVILDGRTYTRRDSVREVRELAAGIGAELEWIECVCPLALAIERVTADGDAHPAANRTPELVRRLAETAEPLEPPKRVVDTSSASPGELAGDLLVTLGLTS